MSHGLRKGQETATYTQLPVPTQGQTKEGAQNCVFDSANRVNPAIDILLLKLKI